MKHSITILLLLVITVPVFSQDVRYEVRGAYTRSLKKENLNHAQSMGDVIADYPSNWIKKYISAEVLATCNGKVIKAVGKSNILSAEQKRILRRADIGTDIVINVRYQSENAVTGSPETNTLHFAATLVPETEAEYPGGYEQMMRYLKENAISKISEENSKQLHPAVVRFTINEQGNIANVQLSASSKDSQIDAFLLEAINTMPSWKPAENSEGIKVQQHFEFRVGQEGC